ncbi:MAG: hypothetical protein NVSMB65_04770 [Chloroflexota bacterium]
MDDGVGDVAQLLTELRLAGEQPDPGLLAQIKARGEAVVAPLIGMALDEHLYEAGSESPDVWAPGHALRLLGELGAAEAVAPLLGLFARDEDWLIDALPECLGHLGEPALRPVHALLADRTQPVSTRYLCSTALVRMAQRHPHLRDDVVAMLAAQLAPTACQSPDDETVNGHIIADLLDLHPVEALPAIQRAFDEDHVDQRIVALQDVQEELGLLPSGPASSRRGHSAQEKELRLWLRCTACAYVRRHAVGTVYIDEGTIERRKRGAETPYSEFVITRSITCPKCGAVDQYALTGEAHLALTAELLKVMARAQGTDLPGDGGAARIAFTRFTVDGDREMHPYAALEMYRDQVAEHPCDAVLRVRYANVLRFLGRRDAAVEQYRMVVQADPANVEAHVNLARLARDAGDRAAARRLYQHVLDVIPTSTLSEQEQEEYLSATYDALRELIEEDLAHLGVLTSDPARPAAPHQSGTAVAPTLPRQARRVGRNDPCPCGSGKKYKKCCGR